jgi:hypothetical protein
MIFGFFGRLVFGGGKAPKEKEPEKKVGGGGMSARRLTQLKRIKEEDEIILAFVVAFLDTTGE